MFDQMRGGAALLSRRIRLIPAIAGAAACKTLQHARAQIFAARTGLYKRGAPWYNIGNTSQGGKA